MSPATFIMLTCGMLLAMAWYANTSKRDKILCTFRRINKTKVSKFVRMSSRYIIFDKKRYDIVPSCCTQLWYTVGLIHIIFPQWVQTLDFTYESRWPLDPNTLKPMVISAEVRKAMNKEEWAVSWAKHSTPNAGKKQSMLREYLPWVAILLVVLVGFWMYNNLAAISNQMAIIQNNLNAIAK